MVHVDIMVDTVIEEARRLSKGSGKIGTDSVSLHHWLLWLGQTSIDLQVIFANFYDWTENQRLTWVE